MKKIIILLILCLGYSATACDIWIEESSGELKLMKAGDPLVCPRLLKKEITKLKIDFCKKKQEDKSKSTDSNKTKSIPAECRELLKK